MTPWSSSSHSLSSRSSASSRRTSTDGHSYQSANSQNSSSRANSAGSSQTRIISNPMPLRAVTYNSSYTGSNGQRPQSQTATILLASSSRASANSGARTSSTATDRRALREDGYITREASSQGGRMGEGVRVAEEPSLAPEGHVGGRETRYSTYTFNNLRQMQEDDSIPLSLWASPQGLDSLQLHTPDSSVEALGEIPDMDDLTPRKQSGVAPRNSSYRKPAPPLTPPRSPPLTRHDPSDPFRRSGDDDRYASPSRFTAYTSSSSASTSTSSPRKFASRLFSPRNRSRSRASTEPPALDPIQQEAEDALADSEWQLVDSDVPADVSNDLRRALGPSGPPVVSGTLRPSPGVRARRKLTSKKSDRALEALRAEATRMMSSPPVPMPPPILEEGTSSGEASSRGTVSGSSRTSGPRAGLNGLGNNGVPLAMHVVFDEAGRRGHASYGSSGTGGSGAEGGKAKGREGQVA